MKPQTTLIHDPRHAPQLIDSLQPPVYRASTIVFANTAALQNRHWTDRYDYSYGTHGTPTVYTLADQIACIEGGAHCLLAPSGLSAINLVNSTLLSTGDEVWLADNMYGPNLEHLRYLQMQFGVVVKLYDPNNVESLSPSDRCKLVWIEAAGSVTMEFPDVIGLITKAKACGATVALDNTWGAGLAFCPFAIGDEKVAVDISVHALTKYPSGGGDVLMGSVTTRDQALHHWLLRMHAIQGITANGDDCAMIYRSLPSMAMRYHKQSETCMQLLPFLQAQAQIAQVLHPSLPTHAGHEHWQVVCQTGLSAGLVSVIFDEKYSWADVCRFVDALTLFKLGFSWGGVTSLVMLYDVKKMRALATPHLAKGYLVRLCIGLEDGADLQADIAQALAVLDWAKSLICRRR